MLQLYGSFLLPVLLGFGIGINLIGWSRAHINIPLVFYFDTRNHIDYRQFLEIPSLLLFTLCYCFWLSMTVVSNTVSPQVWPLVWLFSTILIIFNPLPVFHRTARWWLIKSTIRVFLAGIVRVQVSSRIYDIRLACPLMRLLGSFATSGSEINSLHCTTQLTIWAVRVAEARTFLGGY